jgi:hypothetical protein
MSDRKGSGSRWGKDFTTGARAGGTGKTATERMPSDALLIELVGGNEWRKASDRIPKSFNVRFTEREHAQLLLCRRLSAAGESAHDIAYTAIMAEVHRRMREVGIDPEQDGSE